MVPKVCRRLQTQFLGLSCASAVMQFTVKCEFAVHDGQRCIGPCFDPHERDKVSELQGRRWQLRVQQREGMDLIFIQRDTAIKDDISIIFCNMMF